LFTYTAGASFTNRRGTVVTVR